MEKLRVDEVKEEAQRLLKAIDRMERVCGTCGGDDPWYISGEYTAAVRRASMDLTKSLARLRR